jgi:hypothetical protein
MVVAAVVRLLVALLALAPGVGSMGATAGTTTGDAATYSYDAPAVARVEVRVLGAARATQAQVNYPQGQSAPPADLVRRTSTTPLSQSVATNTASSLGDDFTRALDDIDNGVPRPNVRDPKPFGNDGRGGTTRLPDADGAGNPGSYTENTVKPRPPGGTLDGSRIVVGSDGSVWATTDHFTTWVQVR